MLERNADKIDTFEGILSRKYVRDLKTLIMLGEHYLKPRRRARLRTAQKKQEVAYGNNKGDLSKDGNVI